MSKYSKPISMNVPIVERAEQTFSEKAPSQSVVPFPKRDGPTQDFETADPANDAAWLIENDTSSPGA